MRRLFIAVLLALILLGVSAVSHPETGAAQLVNPEGTLNSSSVDPYYLGCGGQVAPVVDDAYEAEVVELVNEARAEEGVPPLKRAGPLTDAARYHAADMVLDDYFDHDTFDRVSGALSWICGTWERTAAYFSGATGENIAAGYPSPEAVVAGWLASPGHLANILNPGSWEIGVGYSAGGGSYSYYWVQDFAKRPGVYPMIITGESASTETRDVAMYIYGAWDEIRLRNDGGSWTGWQPFQAEIDWTLGPGIGLHTVDAELSDGSQIVATSDSIYLSVDDSPPGLGNLPESLVFLYSIPDQIAFPPYVDLTPLNSGNEDSLDWQVGQDGSNFSVDPLAGTTPESFRVTPVNFAGGSGKTYSNTLTVTVTDPGGTAGSPHSIDLILNAMGGPLDLLFLPALEK
jgi:uncharacterized protein YkwD